MDNISIITYFKLRGVLSPPFQNALCLVISTPYACYPASYAYCSKHMLVVVLNMPEHSSFQDMLFPMLFISKYAKSYASIMDISLTAPEQTAKNEHASCKNPENRG